MCCGLRTNQLTFTKAHEILPPQFLLNIENASYPPNFFLRTLSISNEALLKANQSAAREFFWNILIGSSGTLKNMLPVIQISFGISRICCEQGPDSPWTARSLWRPNATQCPHGLPRESPRFIHMHNCIAYKNGKESALCPNYVFRLCCREVAQSKSARHPPAAMLCIHSDIIRINGLD